MTVNTVPRSNQQLLAHLRTLRQNIDLARAALMHYKDDRVDRDKLEPAARRVDALMNMFAASAPDRVQALAWMSEIKASVEEMTNPKAATALRAAGVEIEALLVALKSSGQ